MVYFIGRKETQKLSCEYHLVNGHFLFCFHLFFFLFFRFFRENTQRSPLQVQWNMFKLLRERKNFIKTQPSTEKKVLTEDKWHMSLFLKQDTVRNIATPLERNAGLQ